MNTKPAYYTGTHRYSFRSGEPGLIVSVVMVRPDGEDWRPCFHVWYPDGVDDYCPISDTQNYKITGTPNEHQP